MSMKRSILVVDDTPDNLRLLAEILAEHDYLVRPVNDGMLALSAALAEPPDLILLDIMMPHLSGYEVCERLKADERTREIPIIFISAKTDVLDKVKAFSLGGVDYIIKPFQAEEVIARIETHLTLQHLRKDLEHKNVELAETLERLQVTQDQLIMREKLAALGQLIAGIAHEINTPLGAIQASVDNINNALMASIQQLPRIFQVLSPERQKDFVAMLDATLASDSQLSSRETRQAKRILLDELIHLGIEHADLLVSMLVNMGLHQDLAPFVQLLREPECVMIVKTAYNLSMQHNNSRNIKMAVERASKVVFSLKNYAHYDDSSQPVLADITAGIDVVLTLHHHDLKQGIEVTTDYEDIPHILCYPDELNQVWTNLIHNAIQAMKGQGTLDIRVFKQEPHVVVHITDSGPGIPEHIQPRIFEPFFTTKSAGEGSGLGLDIVRKIIDRHQGHIEVESRPGNTMFTVLLPANINPEHVRE